ncbi:MAG: hypothetical protein H0X15_12920 [Acidobacteria bacterium]|nr:hypothetical protein [Acidobacteriota bacterium]
MLTVIIILLVLIILMNLAIGFLIIIALGELGASEKYRFEFGPVVSSDDSKEKSRAVF